MAEAINGLNPGLTEDSLLNPSLDGLGSDPFGFQGYRYSTSLLSKKNARNAAEKEAQYNAKVNYAYWVANNLYNSPSAQMARFQEAGLNPNLIYGKENNVVAGSSPSAHGTVATGGLQSGLEAGLSTLSTLVGAISSINGLKLQNAQVRKAQADADLSEQRTDSDFIRSLDPLLKFQLDDLLSHLPDSWDTMTSEQKGDWLNEYYPSSKYGKFLSSGRLLDTGESSVDPDSYMMQKLIGLAKEAKERGYYADELFDALVNLREAQVHNVGEQTSLNKERARYQDWFNRIMAPLLKESKEIENSFMTSEKSMGILSAFLRSLAGGSKK